MIQKKHVTHSILNYHCLFKKTHVCPSPLNACIFGSTTYYITVTQLLTLQLLVRPFD